MPVTQKLSAQALSELAHYDTPTICNAIELFAIRPRTQGYMDTSIRSCFGELAPMVGYALTARFSAAPNSGGAKTGEVLYQQSQQLQEMGGPGVIVFEDIDRPTIAATFGEVMCTTYKTFGAVGLITSGAGRDLDQVQAIKFPVFTSSVNCSHGQCAVTEMNIAVEVGGVTIQPGDLLHGDRNGVTTIPHEIAGQIVDVCRRVAEAENIVMNYCRSASPTPKGMLEAYETLVRRVRKIQEELA